MKQFDIKKGWYGKIEGDLLPALMKEIFGNVKTEGDAYVSSYGVMERIVAKAVSKAVLEVDTSNKSGTFSDEEILGSKCALNRFLEEATGFDAKTRMKREQKKAKEGNI